MSLPPLSTSSRATRALALFRSPTTQLQTRFVSSSPYGRTHVWKRRPKTLPNPTVPLFPQRLVRVDGSTVVHHTTSPRSVIRLTRDTTNNPVWNAARFVGMDEEEDEVTGRLGRFSRRFGDLGGEGEKTGMEWMDEASGSEVATHAAAGEGKAKAKGGDSPAPRDRQTSLVEAVAKARDACRFRYLTAATVCVYGIPVYISK